MHSGRMLRLCLAGLWLGAVTSGCGARTFISDERSDPGTGLDAIADGGVIEPLGNTIVVDPEARDRARSPQPETAPLTTIPVAVPSVAVPTVAVPSVAVPSVAVPSVAVPTSPAPVSPVPPPAAPQPDPAPPSVVEPIPMTPTPDPAVQPEPPAPDPTAPAPDPTAPAPEPEPVNEPTMPPLTEVGECSDPADLGAATGLVATGSNRGARNEVDPSCASSGGFDVAFTWSAPEEGDYEIDTFGSSFDTVLVLYADAECSSETYCNDDAGTGVQSRLTFTASAGATFTIVVDGYSREAVGDYQLSITPIEAVACDPIHLGSELGRVAQGPFFPAAVDFGGITDCSGGARRIPFLWQAPSDGSYSFSSLGSSFDTVLVLRQDCGLATLVCNDDFDDLTSQVEWDLREGEEILIELSAFGDDPASGNGIRGPLQNYTYALSVDTLATVQR